MSWSFNLKVAIGFITTLGNKFLIARRSYYGQYGGYWELPGGKIEIHESPVQALHRELFEELNVVVQQVDSIGSVERDGEFFLFHVKTFMGCIELKAGQLDYRWIGLDEWSNFQFPESNASFFKIWKRYLDSYKT